MQGMPRSASPSWPSRPHVGQSGFAEAALRRTTPSASRYMSTLGRDSEPAGSSKRDAQRLPPSPGLSEADSSVSSEADQSPTKARRGSRIAAIALALTLSAASITSPLAGGVHR
jgi:hypothetical protein